MVINTNNRKSILKTIKKLNLPKKKSHKGQNGKILIIGGSKLFHASPIWAAEIASHFTDMVHFSSTLENNKIMASLKNKFLDGMVINKKSIPDYAEEDDVILIGPGMVRGIKIKKEDTKIADLNYLEVTNLKDESKYARELTYYLIKNFPKKKFVIDAGALQMMDKEWLLELETPAIITPHLFEFERLFGIHFNNQSISEIEAIVKETAKQFNIVIVLKAIDDIISDGRTVVRVRGGNQGLTKGGTGDVLAGLVASIYAKNDPIIASTLSSFLLKNASEKLAESKGLWYNTSNLVEIIPNVLTDLVYNYSN